jgi:hypothetical protein
MQSVIARVTALALCVSASTLAAQQPALTTIPAPELGAAAPPPAAYLPLTSDERWNDYVRSVVGPLAFVQTAVTAGLASMGSGSPRFWERDPGGFGQRFGTAFAARTVNETVKASLSAVLHEDNTYYRCSCQNVFGRFGHALLSTVEARNDNGHTVLGFGRIAGAYAGGLTTMELYQHQYGFDGALRLGTATVATHALTNLVREFVKLPF